MAQSAISTGEQSVTAVGAVTGTLNTAAMTGNYVLKVRVMGLLASQAITVAVEDTANASAFSEAIQQAVFHFVGPSGVEGSVQSVVWRDIPNVRFGVTNSKLRVNATVVTGSPTAKVLAWLEQ